MVRESPSGCSPGEPPEPPRGAECPRKHVSPERGRGNSAVLWLYLRFSSPERFPATPKEFPGSLPAPEAFPVRFPWHCGGWAANGVSPAPLGVPVTSAPRSLMALPPHCPHCRDAGEDRPQQPPARSRSRPQPEAGGHNRPWPGHSCSRGEGQRELGTERSGFPEPMSLPRTDSLGSTKGPWGISRAKGAAAERRGFLGPAPVNLAWEIPAASGTA